MRCRIFLCMMSVFIFFSIGFCKEEASKTKTPPEDTIMASQPPIVYEIAGNGAEPQNPFSPAIGQRVVGWILAGSGTLELILGLVLDANNVYADSYAESGNREMGETFEKLIWVEGIFQLGIGIPFIIAGSIKHGKWHKWEIEHKNLKVSFTGTKIIVNF